MRHLRQQRLDAPIDTPVSVAAVFFRDRSVGDLVSYMQALADALEKASVITNDRLIVSWDGSRLAKDAQRPRVELVIVSLRPNRNMRPSRSSACRCLIQRRR